MVGINEWFSLGDHSLTEKDAHMVLTVFKNDNPLFYWLYTEKPDIVNGQIRVAIDYDYGIDPAKRTQTQKYLETLVKDMAAEAKQPYRTKYQKVGDIRDVLIHLLDGKGSYSESRDDRSVYGIVYNHAGDSEGYARFTQLLLNYMDIDNCFASGTYQGAPHCWNIVTLDDGMKYNADMLLSDVISSPTSKTGDSTYTGKGKNTFNSTHTINTPIASDMNYFLIEISNRAALDYDTEAYRAKWLRGDVTWDEMINVTDIAGIAAHVKNKKALAPGLIKVADVNNDGAVNVADISLISANVKGIKPIPGNEPPRVVKVK